MHITEKGFSLPVAGRSMKGLACVRVIRCLKMLCDRDPGQIPNHNKSSQQQQHDIRADVAVFFADGMKYR
jgi:hypothetical protein